MKLLASLFVALLSAAALWLPRLWTAGNVQEAESDGCAAAVADAAFTPARLQLASSEQCGGHLLLAIVGDVYNVSAGRKHYAKGRSYAHFVGRDATRAFSTGAADAAGLTDDVGGLSFDDLKSIADWHGFYESHEEYYKVGVVAGRYYDEHGRPIAAAFPWAAIEAQAALQEERRRRLPECNSKWTQESGSVVWCSLRSGGIERSWTGVPRLYREDRDPAFAAAPSLVPARSTSADEPADEPPSPGPPSTERCVCASQEELDAAAQAQPPFLREYDGCVADAIECVGKQARSLSPEG